MLVWRKKQTPSFHRIFLLGNWLVHLAADLNDELKICWKQFIGSTAVSQNSYVVSLNVWVQHDIIVKIWYFSEWVKIEIFVNVQKWNFNDETKVFFTTITVVCVCCLCCCLLCNEFSSAFQWQILLIQFAIKCMGRFVNFELQQEPLWTWAKWFLTLFWDIEPNFLNHFPLKQ